MNKLTQLVLISCLLSACAVTASKPPLVVSNSKYIVLKSRPGDTLQSLAQEHLGNARLDWVIAQFNNIDNLVPQQEIVIPRHYPNTSGFYPDGHQVVPILCYHRFGEGPVKMTVSAENFEAQMSYLKQHNFRVIPMAQLVDFLQAKRAIPQNAVVITIDDGYQSTFDVAFPILQKYQFPATVFLYTDFMQAPDALKWQQISTMYQSGLVDFQPHSKTHPNLSLMTEEETQEQYRQRMETEVITPWESISSHLGPISRHTFAYPFGDTSDTVIEILKAEHYSMGVTVQPGPNAAFAYPYMLRRDMIFGDDSLQQFEKILITFEKT